MRIALISDTHVPTIIPELPPPLVDRLRAVDLILHAGDLVSPEVLQSLQAIAETIAVHGNMDHRAVARQLPRRQMLSLCGRNIGLIHGNQASEIERDYLHPDSDYDSPAMETFYEYLARELPDSEIIVFGHFHVPVVKHWRGRLLVNPGSVAPYKDHRSFGLLDLGPTAAEAEIIEL
jgi:putative phosphoesterase